MAEKSKGKKGGIVKEYTGAGIKYITGQDYYVKIKKDKKEKDPKTKDKEIKE